ncbi:hypothetical protein EG328_001576 [Venturia inaequalis]|uniref:Uncharacterized protein n=1 Tax=Venturia inaequalis TaxID=5025 RepID=A0A8H3ZBY4_VENIN|nr:hypothetical protein EG328_001576 [Venturia inaequalis]RDI80422.1 hypothetical protein Vi05172_g9560 [Venturia inaequalis]
MKAFDSLSLLLPLASLFTRAHGFEPFPSAKSFNLCAKLYNGGSGPGRVVFTTLQAQCTDTLTLSLSCWYALPHAGGKKGGEFQCDGGRVCLPNNIGGKDVNDAGCGILPQLHGEKVAFDADSRACSQGITTKGYAVYVSSRILPDNAPANAIRDCAVYKQGTEVSLLNAMPCPTGYETLKLEPWTTYQACVGIWPRYRPAPVRFTWHLSAPGKMGTPATRRGLHGEQFSDMFTVDNTTSTTTDAPVQIVIED